MNDSESILTPTEVDEGMSEKSTLEADDLQTDLDVKESDASDNESIASVASDLSEMESFSDYLPKIERLLCDIGLVDFSVEELQHGYTFQNCVYALNSLTDEKEQYILRVPVCPDFRETDERCEAIENDAFLLGYLADKLPVPRVKAYSTTRDNALNAPFTVQTRLPGQSLDDVYGDLDHKDKFAIADQIVDLLAKIESVTFATAGTFTASCPLPGIVCDFNITAAPSVSIFNEGDEEFMKDPKVWQDRAGPDVKSLLISHLNGWIQKELKDDEEQNSLTIPSFKKLLGMMDDLDHEEAFKDGPYPVVLHHWDLEPRNIMVEKSSGAWRVCGVIDWDDAIALPRPLARKPPAWIWDFDAEGFTGFLDNDHHPNYALSDENMMLKAHFDAKAAAAFPHYLEDAYGCGRWLRRIWTFTRSEIHSTWYLDLVKQLPDNWAARPKPFVPQPDKAKGFWEKSFEWLSHRVQALRL